jgi:transcription-repair coupling factor (superfamily II helicase)
MAVAMKDLEIRGAGNLLGGEQSGHIAGVGFDLYVRMVGEAVSDFRGELPTEPAEVKLDLPVDAHLPHDYIPGERLRMEAYRKLAGVTVESDVDTVAEELADRYGDPPLPVRNLLAVARFRAHARAHGITEISLQGRSIRFAPVTLRESQELRMQRLYPKSLYKTQVSTISVPRPLTGGMGSEPLRDVALLDWCRSLLDEVLGAPVAAAS